MVPMKITITSMTGRRGTVRAWLHAPSIGARRRVAIRFRPAPGTGPVGWREEAYDRALMMLDPA